MSVLYREGPYDGRTVTRAFWDMVTQINNLGVDQFIAIRTQETAESGPRTELRTTALKEAEKAVQYNVWRLRDLFRRR